MMTNSLKMEGSMLIHFVFLLTLAVMVVFSAPSENHLRGMETDAGRFERLAWGELPIERLEAIELRVPEGKETGGGQISTRESAEEGEKGSEEEGKREEKEGDDETLKGKEKARELEKLIRELEEMGTKRGMPKKPEDRSNEESLMDRPRENEENKELLRELAEVLKERKENRPDKREFIEEEEEEEKQKRKRELESEIPNEERSRSNLERELPEEAEGELLEHQQRGNFVKDEHEKGDTNEKEWEVVQEEEEGQPGELPKKYARRTAEDEHSEGEIAEGEEKREIEEGKEEREEAEDELFEREMREFEEEIEDGEAKGKKSEISKERNEEQPLEHERDEEREEEEKARGLGEMTADENEQLAELENGFDAPKIVTMMIEEQENPMERKNREKNMPDADLIPPVNLPKRVLQREIEKQTESTDSHGNKEREREELRERERERALVKGGQFEKELEMEIEGHKQHQKVGPHDLKEEREKFRYRALGEEEAPKLIFS